MHYTIGIAGHIDHGKTTLTKQLTGVDTDRLKEEKERSISIELGFAPFSLPDGRIVGIIDVPGHERFIRQMIAGAVGIDLVVLVVAADEGVMPQTREHAHILSLLGMEKGVIAVTKADAVDEEWLELVLEETKIWASGTFLANAPAIPVSGKTGAGIKQLQEAIAEGLEGVQPKSSHAPARLPIDRVFTIKGAGTVVTGTLYEGTVAEGMSLTILPGGGDARVRRAHVHNQWVEAAYAGQRVALNLTGDKIEHIRRGMTAAAPGYFRSTERMDVQVRMLDGQAVVMKQRSRVRIHIGTSEVIGKLIFFDRNEWKPGEEAVAQLEFEEPVIAKKGELFIIRRLSPVMTLGGGKVLDPYAQRHRFGYETVERLQRLAKGQTDEQVVQFLERNGYASAEEIQKQLGIGIVEFEEAWRQIEGTVLNGNMYVLSSVLDKWLEQIRSELALYHRQYPLRFGYDRASLKGKIALDMSDRAWRAVLIEGVHRGIFVESENMVHLTEFVPELPRRYRQQIEAALTEWRQSELTVPSWKELMQRHEVPEAEAGDLRTYLLGTEEAIELTDDMYINKKKWEEGVRKLQEVSGQEDGLTPAFAKEALGLSRKYVIPFLESLDRAGLTRRTEAGRIWRKKS